MKLQKFDTELFWFGGSSQALGWFCGIMFAKHSHAGLFALLGLIAIWYGALVRSEYCRRRDQKP